MHGAKDFFEDDDHYSNSNGRQSAVVSETSPMSVLLSG